MRLISSTFSRITEVCIKKPLTGKWLILACCVVAASSPGCLTRSNNPSLPYVRPANSTPNFEQASTQVANRIQDLETEMQKLRDKIERLQSAGSDDKVVRDLVERVNQIEKQIGMEASKKAAIDTFPTPAGSGSSSTKSQARDNTPQTKNALASLDNSDDSGETRSASVSPEEKSYRQAYSTFKSGSLEEAIAQFEDHLKKYPKGQFASSAIYWIGEAKLEQGRFDEAVLQFDRVIKEYPGSKKELSALFKQGQSFEKMGDVKSAKIIFQKIVKDNPHTTQGRLASSRLKSLTSAE